MGEKWLTYQQAAELLGSSAEAIRRYGRRKGWRVQRDNHGRALILVPEDALDQYRPRPPKPAPEPSPEMPPGYEALTTELRQRAEKAEGRVDALTEELAGLRERVGRAEGKAEALENALARERAAVATEHTARLVAEGARNAAQASLAAQANGPLARAWRALAGWRG